MTIYYCHIDLAFLTSVMSFLLYVMCNYTPLSTNNYSWYSSLWSFELLHRMWIPRRGCLRHCIYLYIYSPKNKQPCVLLLHSCWIIRWRRVLCSCCCLCCIFLYWFLNINLTLCGNICHTCYIWPWRNCHYCCSISFLRSLILEPSILVIFYLVLYFRLDMSYRTNAYISSDP